MNIKIIEIRKTNFNNSTLAFIELQIDNLIIDGFKVVEGRAGRFLSYPREKGKDDKWYDRVKPVDAITKQEIEAYVLREYDRYIKAGQERENEHSELN
jgi:DNA-binding cell septation regulator SpoVG